MPYTPPSHPSPASSAPASPDVNRDLSLPSASQSSLPRSASYLRKHRRTPSINTLDAAPQASSHPEALSGAAAALGDSVRQSPPPLSDGRELIPRGAILSPPESPASDMDDDESPEMLATDSDKLKDLRDAVSQIPQPRTPSPPPTTSDPSLIDPSLTGPPPCAIRVSFSTGALPALPASAGRKLGHVRSATETSLPAAKSADASLTASEEDSDEDPKLKPPMVRKKSGELVRPALRASHRRPSSMPGTPNFSKAVHFDSHLEHVRHFLQLDRPLAVSAGSSPVDNHESDTEYPFPSCVAPDLRPPPFEWQLLTPNFPHDSHARKDMIVRLEKVWLSADQKSMLGSVAVVNLAFQKHVICRFTLDYWKTVSEVAAQYSHEIRPRETTPGYDRFTFAIKLSDLANLESKTLFFCIRYGVNGQEFWDNNSSTNFQVDFKKKPLRPKNAKVQGAASRPANGLPRSSRRPNTTSGLRPLSVPTSLDAFGNEPNKLNLDQPLHKYLGETARPTGLRLKLKSSTNLAADTLTRNLALPTGAAFSNRYDFGVSLSAARQAAKDKEADDKDNLYMKNVRAFEPSPLAADSPMNSAEHSPVGASTPTLSLPSKSYEELVNKYCFFGSKQSNPAMRDCTLESETTLDKLGSKQSSPTMRDGTLESGTTLDGSKDDNKAGNGVALRADLDTNSALHHSIRLHDSTPYYSSCATVGSPPVSAAQSLSGAGGNDYFSVPSPAGLPRSTPPALVSGAGTPSSEASYHSQQQILPERFHWTTEAQSSTAIRG